MNALCQRCAQLARHLHAVVFGPPKPRVNPEQMASLQLYSTSDRRVRAEPSRRPRKEGAA